MMLQDQSTGAGENQRDRLPHENISLSREDHEVLWCLRMRCAFEWDGGRFALANASVWCPFARPPDCPRFTDLPDTVARY
jgi:hypothetical protein